MKINKHSTVQTIFDQFNTQFPFLKLEFYHKGHKENEGSNAEDQISHQILLAGINPDFEETELALDGAMSVSDFENYMKDHLHLNIQVFRKSSDIWLQTTATDHWSLNKQNGKGQRSTEDYEIDPIDITDFDVE